MIARYNFETISIINDRNTTPDSSLVGNNTATLVNGPVQSQDAQVDDYSLVLNKALSQYVEMPATISTPIGETRMMWLKTTAQGEGMGLICYGTKVPSDSSSSSEFRLNRNGRPQFVVQNSAFAVIAPVNSSSTAPLTDGQWHHVAATRFSNLVVIYIDGVAVSSTILPAIGNATLTSSIYNQFDSLTIGRRYVGNPAVDDPLYFDGIVDDVRLYDAALDWAAIRDICQSIIFIYFFFFVVVFVVILSYLLSSCCFAPSVFSFVFFSWLLCS